MKTNYLSLAWIALFILSPLARADLQFEQKKIPCAADGREFCRKFKPRTKSYVECMQRHMEQLTPECQAEVKKLEEKLEDVKSKMKKGREACNDDFFKLCQGVPLGDEDLRRSCLLRHKRQLSEACAASMK